MILYYEVLKELISFDREKRATQGEVLSWFNFGATITDRTQSMTKIMSRHVFIQMTKAIAKSCY